MGFLYAAYLILTGCLAIYVCYKKPKLYRYIKPLPLLGIISLLVYGLYFYPFNPSLIFLIVVVTLCMAGDIALTFEGTLSWAFGGIFFLLGHIGFIIFYGGPLGSYNPLVGFFLYVAIPATVIVIGYASRITNYNLKILIPVLLYGLLEIVMIISGMAYEFKKTEGYFISLGASLFFVSDYILAWDTMKPFKKARVFVLSTYYSSVGLMIWGIIN